MRRHAASVCIVSAGSDDLANGMAVTAASSFSFEPPSVLVCVNCAASLAPLLSESTTFTLTVLGRQHEAVATAFSRKPSGAARFQTGAWTFERWGAPCLEDAPANLLCVVERRTEYGSHAALIGRVISARLGLETASLVYRDGRYG